MAGSVLTQFICPLHSPWFKRCLLRRNVLVQRGAAILELAVVLPIFLILMAGTFEVGRALNQYLILTQVAYEGVRAGSQLAEVEPACFGAYNYEGSNNPANNPGQLTPAQLSHVVVLDRVGYLLQLQKPGLTFKCDEAVDSDCAGNDQIKELPTATTEYIKESGPAPCADYDVSDSFAVKLSGKYQL